MPARIVAIANQKGGVGKTTTTVNLAACLAERGKRILLVDMDPQANATSGVGMDKVEGQSIYGALLGEGAAADQVKTTSTKRLDIIPSELDLAGAEIDVARSERYLHRFKEAIAPIQQGDHYDYILVDCPPSLGILTMNVLTAAHGLLIPIQCEYYALEGLSVISKLIEQLHDGDANPDLEIEGIVMTMYDMRTNLSQQVVHEVLTHFGQDVFETLIPRSVRLSEAPSFGKPIIAYDKHSTGSAAYRQLAREFMKRNKNKQVGPLKVETTPSRPAPAPTPVVTAPPLPPQPETVKVEETVPAEEPAKESSFHRPDHQVW